MRAVKKNIIVKIDKADAGAIMLLKASEGAATRGIVIAIGSEVTDTKVNNIVTFSQHAGFKYVIDDIEYKTMDEGQVMMILES